MNVVNLFTWRQTVQYEDILRVAEHKVRFTNFQETKYAAQWSRTQTCKEGPVEEARHI